MESLLKTTAPPAKQRKEIDAKPSEPTSDQKKTSCDTSASVPGFTRPQSKSDSRNKSHSTHYPISVDKSTSTSPYESGTSSRT